MHQWPLSGYADTAVFEYLVTGLTVLLGTRQVDAACKYADTPS